jgi:diacylglycerol kinase family enzyme
MSDNYSSIHIIYNPNSTGPSQRKATRLAERLRRSKKLADINVELIATEHAGHAEKLTYDIVKEHSHPLIVSASGDGGYHEVINGAIRATSAKHTPICAVLPTGNANDHRRNTRRRPLYQAIIKKRVRRIDILRLSYKDGLKTKERFAHSYIGFGLTPDVALQLNSEDLTWLKQSVIVVRSFFSFRPFEIMHDQQRLELDSLIFANIKEMAKYVTLDKKAKIDDGSFEVIRLEHASKIRLLGTIVKAATIGLSRNERHEEYTFSTTASLAAQLDGELLKVPARKSVTVACEAKLLKTIS